MTGLAEILARRIARTGPITVAEYMAAALTDADRGYYRTESAIGAEGDFTTAPEISQIFGELIGAWLVDCWEQCGRPNPVRLIELGPGRGTLMQDALRVGGLVPAWRRAIELHLVEINPRLRDSQAARLAAFSPIWHETLSTVPDGPTLLVANEFFDALPIRQLVFHGGAWRERMVAWTDGMGFHFVLSPGPSPLAALLPAEFPSPDEGDLVELSPASLGIAAEIGRRVALGGGAAVIIEYGRAATMKGATLQAIRAHRGVDIFAAPGRADLSAHVDFEALSLSARDSGAQIFGPVTQQRFLNALGVNQRAASLKSGATPTARRAIDRSVERLTGGAAMGDLFKVIAIAGHAIAPAGFPGPARAARP